MGVNFNIGAVVLALGLLAVAYFAYTRTTPGVSGPLRALLMGLRVAAFLLLVFLLLDPRYILDTSRNEPPRVIALVDHSASMTLPADGWDANGAPTRFERAIEASDALRLVVEAAGGKYQTVYFADDVLAPGEEAVEPDGQGTDIARTLDSVYGKQEGENLRAIVVFSDGIETERRLVRSAPPPVAVFTVGVGDTSAPEDVRIKNVEYNSIVRAPSKTNIDATLQYTGPGAKRVTLKLTEDGRTLFARDTTITEDLGEVGIQIPVEFSEPGRRRFQLEADVNGYDAEASNNVREVVIEGEKAGVRVLIVDLHPTWELHFLTSLLKQEQTFDFAVATAAGVRASVPDARFINPGDVASKLGEYDALVLGSIDRDFLDRGLADAIVSFVRDAGKGLLVLPGPSSVFEHRQAWEGISTVLPVRGSPPHRFKLQFTSVRPGAQAGSNPITSQLVPLLSQTDWQTRSPLLGYYAPLAAKPGAEVLLEIEGNRAPAFTYQSAGKGRVAVLSVGPLWRWKFLADSNTLYDEMVSRLLDVLSRGEDTERFVLKSQKNLYDSGEAPVFTAEVFNEKMQPVTGAPVRIEITRVGPVGAEVPLDILEGESSVHPAQLSTDFQRLRRKDIYPEP